MRNTLGKTIITLLDLITWMPLDEPLVFIESPSGKTVIRTTFKLANRIIKKHGWSAPILQPYVSRYKALKILLFGNKIHNTKVLYYSHLEKSLKIEGN